MPDQERWLKFSAGFFLIALIAWAIYSFFSGGLISSIFTQDEQGIRAIVESVGILAPIAFILIVILEVLIAPVPGGPLYFVAGLLFHPLFGGILALIGNVIGAGIAFLLARSLGRDWVENLAQQKHLRHLDKMSGKHGPLVIFLLRINPFTSTDLFSYLAGLSRMSLKGFVLGTGLGLAPLVFIQAYIGDLFADNALVTSFVIWLSALYVVVILSYLLFLGAKKGKREIQSSDNTP